MGQMPLQSEKDLYDRNQEHPELWMIKQQTEMQKYMLETLCCIKESMNSDD